MLLDFVKIYNIIFVYACTCYLVANIFQFMKYEKLQIFNLQSAITLLKNILARLQVLMKFNVIAFKNLTSKLFIYLNINDYYYTPNKWLACCIWCMKLMPFSSGVLHWRSIIVRKFLLRKFNVKQSMISFILFII